MQQRLVIMSSLLLGVFTYVLYLLRAFAAALVKQQTVAHDPDLWPSATWYVLGPWLPASYRIAFCLAVCVALAVFALSRSVCWSHTALLGLHLGLWMLAVIAPPVVLLARELGLLRIDSRMYPVTPEIERQMHYESAWFWVLTLLSAVAFYACLRHPKPRAPKSPNHALQRTEAGHGASSDHHA